MFLLRIPLSPVELWCLTFLLQTWSGVQSHQGDWTISYKCEKNNVRRHNAHTSCFQVPSAAGVEHTTSCRGHKHDTKPVSVLVDWQNRTLTWWAACSLIRVLLLESQKRILPSLEELTQMWLCPACWQNEKPDTKSLWPTSSPEKRTEKDTDFTATGGLICLISIMILASNNYKPKINWRKYINNNYFFASASNLIYNSKSWGFTRYKLYIRNV